MSRHRATSMLNIYGLNYCADHTNGNIYEYSLDIFSDNGDTIIKQRDTASIHGGLFGVPGKKLFFDEVEFIIVSGQTEVEGTGAGAQPPTPSTPLTNCNEVWEHGILTPDLHAAGMDASGNWVGDIIIGTGSLADAHTNQIHVPSLDGWYAANTAGAISAMGLKDCQRYIYAGPNIHNSIQISTFDLSNALWGGGGTGSATLDQTGILNNANGATLVTDSDAAALYYRNVQTSINSIIVDGRSCTAKAVVKKDLTAVNWGAVTLYFNSLTNYITATFNPATGEMKVYVSVGTNPIVETVDRGEWWEFYAQIDKDAGPAPTTEARYSIYPAFSSDGISADVTLTGSITVGNTEVIDDDAKYAGEIGVVRGGASIRNGITAGFANENLAYINLANHDNTEGGYYFEWRPMYDDDEISGDVEILSLDGGLGLLYYDYSENKLTATDGTNTATVDMTLEKDTKYRLGVAFGSSKMRVGVDGDWGLEATYDGAFATGSQFDILSAPEAVNYWRELRGFQTSYLDAYNEINTLMAGGA